jgi:hypothetical protein
VRENTSESTRDFSAVQAIFPKKENPHCCPLFRSLFVSPCLFTTSSYNPFFRFDTGFMLPIAAFGDRRNKRIVNSRAALGLWCYRAPRAITRRGLVGRMCSRAFVPWELRRSGREYRSRNFARERITRKSLEPIRKSPPGLYPGGDGRNSSGIWIRASGSLRQRSSLTAS